MNKNRGFHPQPPVYAILSDLEKFYFLCYDGICFTRTEKVVLVLDAPRSDFLAGMRRGRLFNLKSEPSHCLTFLLVSDLLFSVLLQGYIGMLDAIVVRSTVRMIAGDVCS
jgi:hypothetical protein